MVATHTLHLFTWAYLEGVATPQCPAHPNQSVSFSRNNGNRVVICDGEEKFSHLIRMCSEQQFEAEKQEAMAFFERQAASAFQKGPPPAKPSR
jgi:hypothetical protein